MNILNVKIEDLKSSEYNPRKWSEKAINDVKNSIKEFGFVDPIIVNSNVSRKNIVIGGHLRLEVARQLGYKEVPIFYIDIADIKKEKELNIRLNKNTGSWDYELLANLEEDILLKSGFEEDELKSIFDLEEIENVDVDMDRLMVITVEPPEAPKLKERMAFYCDSIDDYRKIKEFFAKGKSELDVIKLLDMI